MNRRRRFVPAMDQLGLRITPSGGNNLPDLTPEEDCYIPGEHSEVTPSITWYSPTTDRQLMLTDDPDQVQDLLAVEY